MIIKGYVGRNTSWKHNTIIAGIVYNCLKEGHHYQVPTRYVLGALLKANKSPHHSIQGDIPEVNTLFKQFAQYITRYEKVSNEDFSLIILPVQLEIQYTLTTPQMAAMLFYHSSWVMEPRGVVTPQLTNIYSVLRLEMQVQNIVPVENR